MCIIAWLADIQTQTETMLRERERESGREIDGKKDTEAIFVFVSIFCPFASAVLHQYTCVYTYRNTYMNTQRIVLSHVYRMHMFHAYTQPCIHTCEFVYNDADGTHLEALARPPAASESAPAATSFRTPQGNCTRRREFSTHGKFQFTQV
jgi:hypothetical protein